MADEQDQVTERPTGARRWLRWGTVYVDIEPPAAPNPWTTPGWAAPVADVPVPAPPRPSRRPLVLFSLAAVAAALIGFLLVAAFTRNDRPPILTVSTTTTRPRVATTVATTAAARPTTPSASTGGSSTTPSTRPAGGTSTTATARPGGPITIPEGVPPSSAAAPAPTTAPPTTVAPTTTTTTAEPTAFLGVTVEDTFDGVQILEVIPGTGAEAAGLAQGDVITAIDATPVANLEELGAAIGAHEPGDSITVTVQRGAGTVTVRATLGRR